MSKRIRVSVIFLLLVSIVTQSVPVAQQPGRSPKVKPAPTSAAGAAEVMAAANEMLEEVSKMRGLKILEPVKSGVKSRSEIERDVIHNFEESYKPEELDAINKSMLAYGLVPKGFDYRRFMIELLTEQVAGFYRPKSKELFIADWNGLNQQKPIMAHELTHALQDQHFNLQRFEEWERGDSDREAAIHALIEGDATGVMYNYQLKPMRTDISRLPSIAGLSDNPVAIAEKDGQKVFLSAPASIRESLVFPYLYGAAFVQELVKQRGWEGVSRAFTDLPQSTEQIIHFEKYLSSEQPVKVQLPDISSLLEPGWKRIDADINGEFGYYLILSEFIDKKFARTASAGWGGDQSTLYENAGTGRLLLIHLSVWDTPKDAEEFFQAYTKRIRKRYPEVKEKKEPPANERDFITPDGDTHLRMRDKTVLVIEGLSIADDKHLARLFEVLWK